MIDQSAGRGSKRSSNRTQRRDYDLRDWLLHLERTDRLAIARDGVDLEFELAGTANRLDGTRASLFPTPSGRSGTVISGLLSDRAWMSEALGVTQDQLLSSFQQAAEAPIAPAIVEDAQCQTVVRDGEFDLRDILPIPTHNEHDSGAYIAAGLVICRNPETGIQNVAIHRLQVSGPKQLGALLLPRNTLSYVDRAEANGEDLDVAVVIGVSPACLMASQAIVPENFDELGVAGALGGAPVEVVRCLGSEVCVPAAAEIVIEGHFRSGVRAPEGPFGEFPQYYGERSDRHVISVCRVTHRANPLFHTIVGGGLEHLLLGCIPREATILSALQRGFSNVTDVHLSMGGVCRYHLYIQISNPAPGEAKNAILGALAAHYDIKHVTIVDTDVDVHDPQMVEWALATRFQADRDLVIVNNTQGSKLDPSSDRGIGSKLGFDATVPRDAEEFRFKRIRVPGEEDIDLSEVIQSDRLLADFLKD